MVDKTAYELEREERIKANKLKIQELGLDKAAAELEALKPAKRERTKKAKSYADVLIEARRSDRARKAVNYCEEPIKLDRKRPPIDYSERIRGMSLDAETAERLRVEMESKRGSSKGGKHRGPVDSGKGVRIQGGRVYDSKHGVTCHWCRQKTLEDHVTCTHPCCGNGKRMPLSFCGKCLKNRHGEDHEVADASGSWCCPACRGSCGPGCVTCCNCGPCRKKAGLEPTHQIVRLARDAGFHNVHDYLVHLVTGETAEQIEARKLEHSWGVWLKSDSSDGSDQTGGCCSSQEEQELMGTSKMQEDAAPHVKGAGKDGRVTDFFPVRKPTSCRNGRPSSGKGQQAAGGKRKATEVVEGAVLQLRQEDKPEEDGGMLTDADLPMLSSQDTSLSRKQRILQKMGLAPVTVC